MGRPPGSTYDDEVTNISDGFVTDDDLDGIRDILSYDPSRLHAPIDYREAAAGAIRSIMLEREWSDNPDIREISHFEGKMNPEEFNKAITRPIPEEDIEAMKRVGYRILEFGRFNWQDVIAALQTFKEHYGHVDVPGDYVITEDKVMAESEDDIEFDQHLEGLDLGEAVKGLRCGDIDGLEDPIRFAELKELGFQWGDLTKYQRYRFVPMVFGLRLYRHLNGFALPQYNFVVPDSPQWPYWMANMPLGEWAAVARVQQKMIEEHYPERRDMLNALNFMWWLPPGHIDKKYFEPLPDVN